MDEPISPSQKEPVSDNHELWLQVAPLRPRLRQHVKKLSQEYRGQRWYLLHDEASGRFLRFDALAHEIVGRMNGDLSMREILERANLERDSEPLSIDDALSIMARLHAHEALSGSLPVNARDALGRYQRSKSIRRWKRWSNPLAIRVPLFNPNRLLEWLAPTARLLFSRTGFYIWLSLVVLAFFNAISQRDALAVALGNFQFTAEQALIFWIAYPFLKAVHELGHGLAVKVWGGDVNETGISLLVFVPVPYVDASAALGVRDKRRRILVSAAGIVVEMLIAALAFLLWLIVSPGIIRDTALALAILGSISTVLYNANPLLKFDGYYVLEDLLEIPDLARRSRLYCFYLVQRYILQIHDAASPANAAGERGWLFVYGVLSPIYRLTVLFAIAIYLMNSFHILGVLLVSWIVLTQLVKPLYQGMRFLLLSDGMQEHRLSGQLVTALAFVVIAGTLLTPAPLITRAQGVVWPSSEGQILSTADGFVTQLLAAHGDVVKTGQALIQLSNPVLEKKLKITAAKLREARINMSDEREQSRVRGAIASDDVSILTAEYEHLQEQLAGFLIHSPGNGQFVQYTPHHLPQRYVKSGELLGYINSPDEQPIVRVAIEQQNAGLLGTGLRQAHIRLAARRSIALPAELVREFPAGTLQLPSAALGISGGGTLQTRPDDPTGRTSATEVFQLDFSLPLATQTIGIGERAYVKLDHGNEALWRRWSRRLRQLFLSLA